MKKICNIAECTGCMACVNVCAHNAIQVKSDNEGFDRPVVDEGRCVDCGLCAKTCPINNHPRCNEPQKVYSGWSADEAVRLGSSSGGAFTEIARPILASGGGDLWMYFKRQTSSRTHLCGDYGRIDAPFEWKQVCAKQNRQQLHSGKGFLATRSQGIVQWYSLSDCWSPQLFKKRLRQPHYCRPYMPWSTVAITI